MLTGVVIIVIAGIISFIMISVLKRNHPFIDETLLRILFLYHFSLSFVYYLYASFNPSDSNKYFSNILINFRGPTWGSFYGTSTTFIEFVAYPFVKYLNFSYEACMALFAFFGYVGFVYFYIFFREHVRFSHKFFGFSLLTLCFFLPNLHFWTASLGKGSIVFMGIGLFFYGISNMRGRWVAIVIGSLVIYHVRPHIMLVILVSSAIGFMFSSKGVSLSARLLFLTFASIAFYFIYKDVLTMVGIDESEILTQGFDLTHRADELSKASSGVNITSYSLPMQIFTFLYRPLFFDAPGALGLIVSFENLFYLLMTIRLLTPGGIKFMFSSSFLVKTAILSFVTTTIALAQISGNLGLAIRQKSQVMILFLFVIMSFLDTQKLASYKRTMVNKMRKARLAKLQGEKTL